MKQKKIRLAMVVLGAIAFVSCESPEPMSPPPLAGSIDFSRMIAVGDGFMAGYSDGALWEGSQFFSVPAQIARIAGEGSFSQPRIADPGVGRDELLQRFTGRQILLRLSPLSINVLPLTSPPANLLAAQPNATAPTFANLAVPGHTIRDALLLRGDDSNPNLFSSIILRGAGTQTRQAQEAAPSFILCWIGNEEVFTAVQFARAIDELTLPLPIDFEEDYRALLQTLTASGTPIVIANIPDMLHIPFIRTVPTYLTTTLLGDPVLPDPDNPESRIWLIGTWNDGSIRVLSDDPQSDNYALLHLVSAVSISRGFGRLVQDGGLGIPLGDPFVLDKEEIAIIRERLTTLNTVIDAVAAEFGVPVVDVFSLYRQLAGPGITVGGVRLTAEYIYGGFFSLDGIFPTAAGYGLIANAFIETINRHYGANLPPVNLAELLQIKR